MRKGGAPHGDPQRQPAVLFGSVPLLVLLIAASAALSSAILAVVGPFDPASNDHLARLLALTTALALWLGDIGPKGVTALLLLVFVDLLGLAAGRTLFEGFAQPGFIFLVAVLFVSAAIGVAGTTARIGQRLLASARNGTRGYLWQLPLLMLGSAALVSSATARVSLMHPVLDDLVDSSDAGPGLRRYLTLFVANLNPLTSRAFLSGGPGIVVAAELMGGAGHGFGWGEWALWLGVPVTLIFVLSTIGHWLWLAPERLGQASVEPVAFTRADRYVATAVTGMVFLWVTGPAFGIGATTAALLGMTALAFLPGREPTPDGGTRNVPQGDAVLRAMPWDVILFSGATLSFAGILIESGTAEWLGGLLFGPVVDSTASSAWGYLTTVFVFSVLVLLRLPLSNGVSYSALVFPIILSLGQVGDLSSLHIAFMALVAGGLVFLPVQSNPTMISFASGKYGSRDTVISGVLTFLAALVVFQWLAMPYWHWLAR